MLDKYSPCKHNMKCVAPLCPYDADIVNSYWFPDEEICRVKELQKKYLFIRNQKKIAKKHHDDKFTAYTHSMLNRHMRITKNIEGLDPDKLHMEDETQIQSEVEKWKENKPEISPEKQTEMKERGKELAKKKGDDVYVKTKESSNVD